jgi:hypothetical protein
MAARLTEEQESFLAGMVDAARDHAKRAWKSSDDSSQSTLDHSFDAGFEAAMDYALSDEFGRLISKLKSMLDDSKPLH